MKIERITKVKIECARLMSRIDDLLDVSRDNPISGYYPIESGAVRRASMDLTRALADMRKPDWPKLPGDK